MKLKNKKTGEIVDLVEGYVKDSYYGQKIEIKPLAISNKEGYVYDSLAELNEEWEDYEEPEEDFWYIDSDCETYGVSRAFNQNDSDDVLFNKSIGNYFDTKEEAEKAVEKLKAWKRLKDKGFRFTDWNCALGEIYFKAPDTFFDRPDMLGEAISEETSKDFDLLFSREDD